MEFAPYVGQLVSAVWRLKWLFDQHVDNKNEIKGLQESIQQLEDHIKSLPARLKEAGVPSGVGKSHLKKLDTILGEATQQLEGWATDKQFFRVFNSEERMQKVERLRGKVNDSFQIAEGILNTALHLHTSKEIKTLKGEVLKAINGEVKGSKGKVKGSKEEVKGSKGEVKPTRER